MKSSNSRGEVFRLVCVTVGVLYLLVLTWLLLNRFRSMMEYGEWTQYIRTHTNLIPFSTISFYMSNLTSGMMNNSIIVRNLLGNLLPFLPMGILLPVIFEKMKHFGWFLLTQFCVITVFEAIQLLTTTGSFDVDDILLNLVGAVVGWFLWLAAHRIYTGMQVVQKKEAKSKE